MASLMLRDLPDALIEKVRTYARVRGIDGGLPAAAQELLERGLAAADTEIAAEVDKGPRAVVVPKTCQRCRKAFEIHCQLVPGFSILGTYHVPCPHCHFDHHLQLPGDIVDVVKDAQKSSE